MLFRRKMREIHLTNNLQRFGRIQNALGEAGIKYETKVVQSGYTRRHSALGGFGGRPDLEAMYYIYVSAEDEGRAKELVSEVIRNMGGR